MLAKLLFFVTIINLSLGTNFELPRNDLIILETGERVEGHINSITDGVITVKTEQGEKTIVRAVNVYSTRDIAEIGIFFCKRHSGHIKYLGDEAIEIHSTTGKQTIDRALVRKIIISHESVSPFLDL